MICEECNVKTRVIRVFTDYENERIRECPQCGCVFKTIEKREKNADIKKTD